MLKTNNISIISVFFTLSLCSTNAFSEVCIKDATITALQIGWIESSGLECPDKGNCIRFEYANSQVGDKSGFLYVESNMNLNDGGKGYAMFESLKLALTNGLTVEAGSDSKNCGTKWKTIDSIKLSR